MAGLERALEGSVGGWQTERGRAAVAGFGLLLVAWSAGCAQGSSRACERVTDCARGELCVDGRCSTRGALDAGADAGPDGGSVDGGATDAAMPDDSGPRDAGFSDAGPTCPPDPCAGVTCSGRGWCEDGLCECDPGYAGSACEQCGRWPGSAPDCRPTSVIDGSDLLADILEGTAADDAMRGLGGDDVIRGLDGDDFIHGNAGDDVLNGNAGADMVLGGDGADLVQGGAGDDFVGGGGGDDRVVGGGGVDRLKGDAGNDVLIGETAEGVIDGANDRYVLDGLGDDEIVDTGGTADTARCESGVWVTSNTRIGADRILLFNTGGSVRIRGDAVERIVGCGCL